MSFTASIFPAILNAQGEYIVPDNVPANEFLNLEGDKMSTSRNYAVWLHQYLEDFPGKQDVLRYPLCSIMPENKDADFTWKDVQARNNNELVAILGNFINRVVVLMNKYYEGTAPIPANLGGHQDAIATYQEIQRYIEDVEKSLENFRFREAQASFIDIARAGNKFLTEEEPWKKWKTDPEAVAPVLWSCLEIIGVIGVLSRIFLPVLFDQISDEQIDAQLEKLATANQPASPFPPIKDEIDFDEIRKVIHSAIAWVDGHTIPRDMHTSSSACIIRAWTR